MMLRKRHGQGTTEYIIILAAIAAIALFLTTNVGGQLKKKIGDIVTSILSTQSK